MLQHCVFSCRNCKGVYDEVRKSKTSERLVSSRGNALGICLRMGLFYMHSNGSLLYPYPYTYGYTCTYEYTYICSRMYVCRYVCVCMYVCMFVCMYACMHVRMYVCNIHPTHPPSHTLELASAAAARSRLIESYSLRTPALSLERVSRSATCCTRSCSSRSRNVCTSFVAASCLRRKSPSCALHDKSCRIHHIS